MVNHKKGLCILLMVVALLAGGAAAAEWERTYDFDGEDDRAVRVVTEDTFIYVLATCTDNSIARVATVIRYGWNGSPNPPTEWSYVPDTGELVEAVDLVVTEEAIFALVSVDNGADKDFHTVGFDKDDPGPEDWVDVFDGGHGDDVPYAMAPWGDGAVVTGSSQGATAGKDFYTIAYDGAGDVVWAIRHSRIENQARDDVPAAIAVDDDDYVYVTGESQTQVTPTPTAHIWTVKYNCDSGAVEWDTLFDILGTSSAGVDVEWMLEDLGDEDEHCFLFVTGTFIDDPSGKTKTVTISYDPGEPELLCPPGAELDVIVYEGDSADKEVVVGMATMPFEDIQWEIHRYIYLFLRETQSGTPPTHNARILQYDVSEGGSFDLVWDEYRSLSDPGDSARAIIADEYANAYVAGTFTDASQDVWSAKYGEQGGVKKDWTLDYDGNEDVCGISFGGEAEGGAGAWIALAGTTTDTAGSDVFVARRDAPMWGNGWEEVMQMPDAPSGMAAKKGAWLCADPASGKIYAAKGKKTGDFYEYDPSGEVGSWRTLASIPTGTSGKHEHYGCRGVCDGLGHVYMTKGNKTLEFWRYTIAGDTWDTLASVPPGEDEHPVKHGADMVFVPDVPTSSGSVFLLKGRHRSFYQYDAEGNEWRTLDSVPFTCSQSGFAAKEGSFLTYDDENQCIYAHQARYNDGTNHYLYRYVVADDSWRTTGLAGMPLLGQHRGMLRRRDCRDGSNGVWLDGGFYALKGHKTQQLFRYDADGDSWVEQDTLPVCGSITKKKYVWYGGDVAHSSGALFALKGGMTNQFWRYVPPDEGFAGGGVAGLRPGSGPGRPFGNEEVIAEGVEAYAPRWFSDGSAVVYFHEDEGGWNQVYMCLATEPDSEIQLTFEEMDCENPVPSPDGSTVAFQVLDTATDCYQIATVKTDLDTKDGSKPAPMSPGSSVSIQGQPAQSQTALPGMLTVGCQGPCRSQRRSSRRECLRRVWWLCRALPTKSRFSRRMITTTRTRSGHLTGSGFSTRRTTRAAGPSSTVSRRKAETRSVCPVTTPTTSGRSGQTTTRSCSSGLSPRSTTTSHRWTSIQWASRPSPTRTPTTRGLRYRVTATA